MHLRKTTLTSLTSEITFWIRPFTVRLRRMGYPEKSPQDYTLDRPHEGFLLWPSETRVTSSVRTRAPIRTYLPKGPSTMIRPRKHGSSGTVPTSRVRRWESLTGAATFSVSHRPSGFWPFWRPPRVLPSTRHSMAPGISPHSWCLSTDTSGIS